MISQNTIRVCLNLMPAPKDATSEEFCAMKELFDNLDISKDYPTLWRIVPGLVETDKICAIKTARVVSGMGLREAKDFVESGEWIPVVTSKEFMEERFNNKKTDQPLSGISFSNVEFKCG